MSETRLERTKCRQFASFVAFRVGQTGTSATTAWRRRRRKLDSIPQRRRRVRCGPLKAPLQLTFPAVGAVAVIGDGGRARRPHFAPRPCPRSILPVDLGGLRAGCMRASRPGPGAERALAGREWAEQVAGRRRSPELRYCGKLNKHARLAWGCLAGWLVCAATTTTSAWLPALLVLLLV